MAGIMIKRNLSDWLIASIPVIPILMLLLIFTICCGFTDIPMDIAELTDEYKSNVIDAGLDVTYNERID